MSQPYNLPATAICPGCNNVVVLPAEPIYEDTPPAICAECESVVPDYRRPDYVPPAPEHPEGFVMTAPEPPKPVEEQRYSRRNLFRSLGGIVADKGIAKVEEVKSRFTDEI